MPGRIVIEELLERFRAEADAGPFAYEWCHHAAGRGAHDAHTVLGFIIHGNEWGTLPAALRLLQELRSGELAPGGPVTLLLGNPEAARANQRFLEEDFNRVFTFDREAASHERRRAEVVRPILDSAHFFLDFHQTQTPTESAFWTFPWAETFGLWARALAIAPIGLTRPPGQVFSKGTCCLDEYVRGRGHVGITVEVGTRGEDRAQAVATYRGARRLIELRDAVVSGQTTLADAANGQAPLSWFRTTHVVPATTKDHRLRPGLTNWTRVSRGELLSADGAPRIEAPADGAILFPKYPGPDDPPPAELFRLGERIDAIEELGRPETSPS